jgi:Icc-related predicted phosphoesterase
MRIYYTSDLHGSEKCWRKFLATPKYYQADVIMIGGDITGKFIVPIIYMPKGRAEATFMGVKRKLKKEKDIDILKQQIANSGHYAIDVTPEEHEEYRENPTLLDKLFTKILCERLQQWVDMADERLKGQNVRCFISAGNDDIYEVDEILEKSEAVEVHDGKIFDLGDGFEMFGLCNSNMTPWNCPRDISEEELAQKIDVLANQINNMDRAIFDIHVPPYGTDIDDAPELTEDMSYVLDSTGKPKMIPVGSTAVREAILKYQPMIGFHGHIHESSGIRKLGKTTIINPGSEYAEGILRGAVIDLDAQEGLANVNLVVG